MHKGSERYKNLMEKIVLSLEILVCTIIEEF